MSNFVSNADAATLFEAVGKKKLTVTDTMPTAAEANVGVSYLYLGADTQDFEEGGVYKCQEITPATDPKTYEYIHIFTAKVDLSLYKRIFGGTVDAWDLLTDEQKAQYEYTFFDGDSNDYFAVVDAVTDGDMHPVTSNAVAEEVEDLDAEISDIVNVYGSKNLFKNELTTTTSGNVTFTVNNDSSVSVSGTNGSGNIYLPVGFFKVPKLGNYIFSSGAPADYDMGFLYLRNVTDDIDMTPSGFTTVTKELDPSKQYSLSIYVPKNKTVNRTYYPMCRIESIKDSNYEPYSATNRQLTENKMSYEDNGILGAKNLFELKLTTQTSHGVTATVNNDGTIVVNGTNDGTASWFWLKSTEKFKLNIPSGKYLVSGSPEGTSTSSYCLKFYDEGDGSATLKSYMIKNGEEAIVDIDNTHYYAFYLWVGQNQSPSNVTFKPMIRLATDADETYQPYAMTNKQLTDAYGLISRRFDVIIQNAFSTAVLPNDWQSGYRFIYVLINYGNMEYLLAPTVLPTESLAIGKEYAMAYNDGQTTVVVTFVIDSSNNVTLTKKKDPQSKLSGAWFCLMR